MSSPKEIKKECELMYKQIKDAEIRLEEIRKVCTHENTFVGLYSYRAGCVDNATICSDCGSFIKLNIQTLTVNAIHKLSM